MLRAVIAAILLAMATTAYPLPPTAPNFTVSVCANQDTNKGTGSNPILLAGDIVFMTIRDKQDLSGYLGINITTGETVWKNTTTVEYSPIFVTQGPEVSHDGTTIFVTMSETLYAIDAVTGKFLWFTPVPNAHNCDKIMGSKIAVLPDGSAVGAISCPKEGAGDYVLYTIDPTTGKVIAKVPMGYHFIHGTTQLAEPMTGIVGTVKGFAYAGRKTLKNTTNPALHTVTPNGHMAAFDIPPSSDTFGQSPLMQSNGATSDLVFVGSASSGYNTARLCAYSIATQAAAWCYSDTEAGFGSIVPNPANNSVFLVDIDNELVNIDSKSGRVISTYGNIEVAYGVGVAPHGKWGIYIYESSDQYMNCYAGSSGAQEWSVMLPGEISMNSYSAPLIHKGGYVAIMGDNPGGCGDEDQQSLLIYKLQGKQ